MRHFLYTMQADAPAPAGDGDTKSWFRFYKWNVGGENFVPRRAPFLEAVPGDYLWFILDNLLLGGASLVRVETPPLPVQRQELWYNADEILEFRIPPAISPKMQRGGEMGELIGSAWMKEAKKRK